MEYIAKVLDDTCAHRCGKCANCLGRPLVPVKTSEDMILKAQQFVREDFNIINPRKSWPIGIRMDGKNKIHSDLLCENGRVLSNYGDAGWGQLVEASYLLLKEFARENEIKWVTNIPSVRRPMLVKSFAERLSCKLGLKYVETIIKVQNVKCQKELNNSYLQYKNAFDSFEAGEALAENVLLVDDMVDSRWTFTVCGYKLRAKGSGKVFPYALANSAGRNVNEIFR